MGFLYFIEIHTHCPFPCCVSVHFGTAMVHGAPHPGTHVNATHHPHAGATNHHAVLHTHHALTQMAHGHHHQAHKSDAFSTKDFRSWRPGQMVHAITKFDAGASLGKTDWSSVALPVAPTHI